MAGNHERPIKRCRGARRQRPSLARSTSGSAVAPKHGERHVSCLAADGLVEDDGGVVVHDLLDDARESARSPGRVRMARIKAVVHRTA
jgi:hypothetical protein